MPQDYRRFNGPEDSIPYQRFTKDFVKTYDEHYAELLDENGKRTDGRALEEARSMCRFCMYTGFWVNVVLCAVTYFHYYFSHY